MMESTGGHLRKWKVTVAPGLGVRVLLHPINESQTGKEIDKIDHCYIVIIKLCF